MEFINNDTPMISIVMPAYNAGKFITEAINSVVNQTYKNWELIVIDDGSSDNTVETIKFLAAEDERIHFYANEKNIGVAETRNRGFDIANGEYIALLDSDDIWLCEKLEKQIVLAKEKEADIIYTSYEIIDIHGNKTKEDYIVPSKTGFDELLGENHIGCSTVLLRKRIIEKYRFNKSFYHEDYVLWLQLLKDGFSAYGLTEALVKYRLYTGSRASNKFKSAKMRWIIYREYLKLPLIKSVKSIISYALAGIKKYA